MATQRSEQSEDHKVWTIAEAKARLSEILRLAESEGPQRIGTRKSYVVVPEHVWLEHEQPERMPMGQWLIENLRGLGPLELPDRSEGDSNRRIPYADWSEEEWAEWERKHE